MAPVMDAGTRIIGGVSAEFWISGFGAQPDNVIKPPLRMTQSIRIRRNGDIEGRTASVPFLDLRRVFINTSYCMKNKWLGLNQLAHFSLDEPLFSR
jgi:hypothetical protein